MAVDLAEDNLAGRHINDLPTGALGIRHKISSLCDDVPSAQCWVAIWHEARCERERCGKKSTAIVFG